MSIFNRLKATKWFEEYSYSIDRNIINPLDKDKYPFFVNGYFWKIDGVEMGSIENSPPKLIYHYVTYPLPSMHQLNLKAKGEPIRVIRVGGNSVPTIPEDQIKSNDDVVEVAKFRLFKWVQLNSSKIFYGYNIYNFNFQIDYLGNLVPNSEVLNEGCNKRQEGNTKSSSSTYRHSDPLRG